MGMTMTRKILAAHALLPEKGRVPSAIRFALPGEPQGWISGKDPILHIIGRIGAATRRKLAAAASTGAAASADKSPDPSREATYSTSKATGGQT
jgi:homoaconitase/3-isopropylmalate dehydratase large subunit